MLCYPLESVLFFKISCYLVSGVEVILKFLILCRPKKLPTVPETLLKRRKKLADIRQARAAARKATAKVKSS